MGEQGVTHYRWDKMSLEEIGPGLTRRLISGERLMLAHVYLDAGRVIPWHSHENEQCTYILEGSMTFWIGDDDAEPITVADGEVLHIPSNVLHRARALEATLDLDVFTPPRQDWLDKTDDYLR